MATVEPFRPYRYAPSAGPLDRLVTQPYDKISPEMRERYIEKSPHNLVRIILGERRDGDHDADNVYTRAAGHLRDWIAEGVLAQDRGPSFYPYFQDFVDPDSGARLTRRGFIGLGGVEEYAAGVVHRHEQTLSGPKKDRLELLRHTRAHFGQLFMLYPDPEGSVDGLLAPSTAAPPMAEVTDEYGCVHRLWRVADARTVAAISQRMADKKLVIADGHHRYETALAYSKESPLESARRVMMTFVNMHSSGLRILATHRVIGGLDHFKPEPFLDRLRAHGRLETLADTGVLKAALSESAPETIRIGIAMAGEIRLLEVARQEGALDVPYLHTEILDGMLGIGEEAVREERNVRYVRGIDAALEKAGNQQGQVAFLLQPTTVDQVAQVSFGGGVMPQKSTDFYPKLLSGLTIYKLD